ncbi:MAG: tetratricopeptide repeat protein [Gemmatimonadota bacterium]
MRRSRSHRRLVALVLGTLLPAACAAQQEATLEGARAAERAGRYDQALSLYERLDDGSAASTEARAGRLDVLLLTGRYAEAAELAGTDVRLATRRARALLAQGFHEEAAQALDAAVAADVPDALAARVLRGELYRMRGELDRARATWDGLIDAYNRGRPLDAQDLVAVGTAVRRLGAWESVYFHDAVKAYDEAIAADPGLAEAQVAMATLFLDKYDSGEAKQILDGLLERNARHPEALLAQARALHFDGSGQAEVRAREALEVNPDLVEARVFLARLALESEDEAGAIGEAQTALGVDSTSLEALSVLAAAHWLEGDSAAFHEVEARVLALNPRYSALYTDLADLAAQRRLYASAADLARRAVALDARDWEGHGHLGLNLLRIGAIDEGRTALEAAFAGDPFNVWFKNTLDLLDTFEHYDVIPTEHFRVVLHERESAALAPYVTDMAERAYAALEERYGIEPPTPIRLEVYPDHADFSVRTVGLSGIGALGVSFGPVLAMDSPSAQPRGDFNWASTLWHEVAHSFHMAVSENRVPRWFTEGLAVHEQRRATAGWGFAPSPMFLHMFQEGGLRPLSELNEGFMQPRSPQEVPFSYLLASIGIEWIEEQAGFEGIRAFLVGYRDGKDTGTLIREVTGMETGDVDEAFDRYVRERYGHALDATRPRPGAERLGAAHPDDFSAQLQEGQRLLQDGDLDGARTALERAAELFPEYGGPDGPFWQLARLEEQAQRPERAIAHAERLLTVNESHVDGATLLARLEAQTGDTTGAIQAWERVLEITPLEAEPHAQLAALLEARERWSDAARERAAVVALDPADRAEAFYRLAEARFRAGQIAEARSAVLSALEIAPSYGPALDLLLRIRGTG